MTEVTDQPSVDPDLAPLGDNGGLTPTHRLRFGSPAIDQGDDAACLARDQRHTTRPADGDDDGIPHCDIGAYEQQFSDCNDNGTSDAIEIADGTVSDGNDNGIPDQCEVPGDVNNDQQVDLGDLPALLACHAGAHQPPPLGCNSADLNEDGVVDMRDFREYSLLFEGD